MSENRLASSCNVEGFLFMIRKVSSCRVNSSSDKPVHLSQVTEAFLLPGLTEEQIQGGTSKWAMKAQKFSDGLTSTLLTKVPSLSNFWCSWLFSMCYYFQARRAFTEEIMAAGLRLYRSQSLNSICAIERVRPAGFSYHPKCHYSLNPPTYNGNTTNYL